MSVARQKLEKYEYDEEYHRGVEGGGGGAGLMKLERFWHRHANDAIRKSWTCWRQESREWGFETKRCQSR
jgi:hypothetical protein